jgi:hypothetical protein
VAAVSGAIVAVNVAGTQAVEAEIHTLRTDLSDAEIALRRARAESDADRAESGRAERELRDLRTTNRDLVAEAARLQAALAAYETKNIEPKGSQESPITMKAKVASLQAHVREQTATIESLRAEAAALNERLARQSAHYMDEMKRLGAGTLPASGEPRPARQEPPRRTLSDRINDPRVVRLTPLAEKQVNQDGVQANGTAGSLFSLNDQVVPSSPSHQSAVASMMPSIHAANDGSATTREPVASAQAGQAAPRRPRLLERITSIEKPS